MRSALFAVLALSACAHAPMRPGFDEDASWLIDRASQCAELKSAEVDFDGTGHKQHVSWRRCGPAEREDGPMPQPLHIVLVHKAGPETDVAHVGSTLGISGDSLIERVDVVDVNRDRHEELLVVAREAGTGGYLEWCLFGRVRGGKLACWDTPPDLEAREKKSLGRGEHLCCKGHQLEVVATGIQLTRPVFDRDDANCCPSKGKVSVELKPAGEGALEIDRLQRLPE